MAREALQSEVSLEYTLFRNFQFNRNPYFILHVHDLRIFIFKMMPL